MTQEAKPLALAAVLLGLGLAVFRSPQLQISNHSALAAKQAALPELYAGDPAFEAAFEKGFYLFGPRQLGRTLGALGLRERLDAAVGAVQLACWAVSILFFFLLAERLTGSAEAALLAALLYAWGVPVFKLADAPYTPSNSIGRSMSAAAVLPALWLYFTGRRGPAWLLTTLSIYLHANPGLYVLMLFGLNDLWRVLERKERIQDFALRSAACAALLVPLALAERGAGIPAEYARVALIGLAPWPPLPDYAASDWLLFLEGLALLAAAWPAFRLAPAGREAGRLLLLSGALLFLSWLTRAVLYPVGFPLSEFLLKITSGFAYLFLAEILSLIAITNGLSAALARGGHFAALAALVCLAGSHRHDFVLRALGVPLVALLAWGGGRKDRAAGTLAGAGLAASWVWQGGRGALALPLARLFGLSGGIFSLPFFHRETPWAWLGALALAWGPVRNRVQPRIGAACALVLLCAGLFAWPRPQRDWDWQAVMDYFRRKTPADSFALLPYGRGHKLFEFMLGAERAGFDRHDRYAAMLYEHGRAAVPLVERMRDLGYDLSCCRTWREIHAEQERVNLALDRNRVEALAAKHGLTHVIAVEPYDPMAGAEPVFRSGEYRVYAMEAVEAGKAAGVPERLGRAIPP